MELYLDRTYAPTGTNGEWRTADGELICRSIELPWRDNRRQISCVPEGRYRLKKIKSPTHGICLELLDVPQRGDIQVHKANWALKQLKGCIAPVVSWATNQFGVGWQSGVALAKLEGLIFPVLASGEAVWVTIRKARQN